MQFALDSCILIDCRENKTGALPLLNRMKGAGHGLLAPLTVIGEVIHVCFDKGYDVHEMVTILERPGMDTIIPSPELRDWCRMVDEVNDEDNNWGSSVTDRTRLAYAITGGADYFVTHHSEIRNLRVPSDAAANIEVIDMDQVKMILKKH
ncbi:MAG: hypothetical protein LLG16_03860 [Euryarchaeota archaeon]|nr:hypothetical protein [Euryarchaeota archaeon]